MSFLSTLAFAYYAQTVKQPDPAEVEALTQQASQSTSITPIIIGAVLLLLVVVVVSLTVKSKLQNR